MTHRRILGPLLCSTIPGAAALADERSTGLLGAATGTLPAWVETGLGVEPPAQAAPGAAPSNNEELAKKLANPIADLISLPFQLNYDDGFGPADIPK